MRIDGKLIASKIKEDLKKKKVLLSQKNILPQLAVVLIGRDPSSLVYVKRKEKLGGEIGAKVTVYRFETIPKTELLDLIDRLNKDKAVHGIIIQRPAGCDISKEELDDCVIPGKDVDGFNHHSCFNPPIAEAVVKILEYVFRIQQSQFCAIARNWDKKLPPQNFINWLKKQRILVIGRGETAGKPIANYFMKKEIEFTVAHSKTADLKRECLKSTVILSCVGRSNIVRHDMITDKTILIGVGLHPENNKLATDYNLEEIAEIAAFYTPVPGGVGPVNVACLFENLVKAAMSH